MLTALGLLANVEHGDWVTVAENGGKVVGDGNACFEDVWMSLDLESLSLVVFHPVACAWLFVN
jgi:hypothetical protein